MTIMMPDGSMAYCHGDDLPPDAVRVNADGSAYTPPVIPQAPVTPTPAPVHAAAMIRANEMAEIELKLKQRYGLDFFGVTKK